jgi:hypothetical protein
MAQFDYSASYYSQPQLMNGDSNEACEQLCLRGLHVCCWMVQKRFFFFERNQERSKANNIYFSKLRGIYFVQRLVTFSAVGALRANYYAFRVDKHQG